MNRCIFKITKHISKLLLLLIEIEFLCWWSWHIWYIDYE